MANREVQKGGIIRRAVCVVCLLVLGLTGCAQMEPEEVQPVSIWAEPCYYQNSVDMLIPNYLTSEAVAVGNTVFYSIYESGKNSIVRRDYETGRETILPITIPVRYGLSHFGVYGEENIQCLYTLANGSFLLAGYDQEGNKLILLDITAVLQEYGIHYVSYFEVGAAGQTVFASEKQVVVLDSNGEFLNAFEAPDRVEAIGTDFNGDVVIQYLGTGDYELQTINAKGEKGRIYTANISAVGNHSIVGMDSERLGITTRQGYQEYNITENTVTELVQWMSYGIEGYDVIYATALTNGNIVFYYENYSYGDGVLMENYLHRADANAIDFAIDSREHSIDASTGRLILTLGVWMIDENIQAEVASFNANSEKYMVQIEAYHDGVAENEIPDAARMQTEIMNGRGPDMLMLTPENSYGMLVNGLYADIYPYMKEDASFDRSDYFDNILTAYESEGALYAVVTEFGIDMLLGKGEYVGESRSLSMEELYEMAEDHPRAGAILNEGTREELLSSLMTGMYSELVDWETGENSFDSEEFVRLLEFCDEYGVEENLHGAESYQNGEILMRKVNGLSPLTYDLYQYLYQDDVSALGYPSSDGNGYVAENTAIAMMANAQNKEGVWEYMKYQLGEEAQAVADPLMASCYPVRVSSYEEMVQELYLVTMEKNELGELVPVPKMSNGYGDVQYPVYALQEGSMDEITEIIHTITEYDVTDSAILRIVKEEATDYFAQDKTAEEAAAMIQSRVHAYMNEIQ